MLAAVAAVVAFADVHAFAVSFGVGTGGLGAGDNVISSCGNGMTLAYSTAFYSGLSAPAVNGIDVSNIPAGCLGRELSVTFTNASDRALGSAATAILPLSGTNESIAIVPRANPIDASQISGVSVVVS